MQEGRETFREIEFALFFFRTLPAVYPKKRWGRNSGPTSGVTVQFAGSIYANRLNAKPISLLFSLYFLYLGPLTYHLDSAYILD